MYVCMHVCMYALCMYVCMCTYVRMYVFMYVRMYVCMYVCMYVFMYVRMYVCIYVRMHVCMYVCVCMCVRMYVYVCMCVYACLHVCKYACMYVCMYYVHICMCVQLFASASISDGFSQFDEFLTTSSYLRLRRKQTLHAAFQRDKGLILTSSRLTQCRLVAICRLLRGKYSLRLQQVHADIGGSVSFPSKYCLISTRPHGIMSLVLYQHLTHTICKLITS